MTPSDVEILALTSDPQLIQALREAEEGSHRVYCAPTADDAMQIAAGKLIGVFVTDVPLDQLSTTIAPLELLAPGLVTIVAADRDHGNELLELNNSGPVFRFLLKPVSTGQLRLYVEAAARRHIELIARGPQLPEIPAPVPVPPPRRNPAFIVAGVLGAIAAIAVSFFMLRPGETEAGGLQLASAPSAGTLEMLGLLAKARRAEQEGQLTAPAEHNAIDLYTQALALDPTQTEASQALTAIGDLMFERAESALAAGQLDEARAAIANARRALPGHPRLSYYATRLEVEEQRAKISQALQAAGTGAMSEAAGLIEEAAQVRLGESGAVTQARAELARREEAEDRMESLLHLAQTRTAEGQLVEPADDSALHYVQAARQAGAWPARLAPVASSLADAMIARSRTAAEQGSVIEAKEWLVHAREADPQSARLAAAETEVAAASERADRWAHLHALALQRLDEGRYVEPGDDSAASYLATLRSESPAYPGLGAALARLSDGLITTARGAIEAKQLPEARQRLDAVRTLGLETPEYARVEAQYASAVATADAEPTAAKKPAFASLVRRKYVRPDYPLPAEKRQIEGRVEMALTVDATGKVKHVEVTNAKPQNTFEKAAIAAAQKWEYQPAEVDGQPVEARTLVAIDFTLE
jgi:TonB family protein